MIRLSINFLDGVIQLLSIIDENPSFSIIDIRSLNRIMGVKVGDMISLASECHWIEQKDHYLILTNKGKKILDIHNDYTEVLRVMLWDYIKFVKPSWCGRIPFGRKEASIFMSIDEKACFYEANLMEKNPDIVVALWWKRLALEIGKIRDEHLYQIGLMGEEETILYELDRTGSKPEWLSIESNLIGYDICSIQSKEDKSDLFIEVKASTDALNRAYFFLSANEWNVANSANNYKLYIWLFEANKKNLAVLTPNDVRQHIPENKEEGRWESVKIPYRTFATFFQQII